MSLASRIVWCFVFLLGFCAASRCEEDKERDVYVLQQVKDTIEDTSANYLTLWIEDCSTAIDLPQKSIAKLKLAAKGAAAKFAEQKVKSERDFIIGRINDLLQDSDEFLLNDRLINLKDRNREYTDVDEQVAKSIELKVKIELQEHGCSWNFRRKNGSSGYGRQGGLDKLAQVKTWANVKRKLISNDKLKAYDVFRKNRINKSATLMSLNYMTIKLKLNEKQKEQVAEWLEGQIDLDPGFDQGSYYDFIRTPMAQLKFDGLDEILSPAQLQLWKTEFTTFRR